MKDAYCSHCVNFSRFYEKLGRWYCLGCRYALPLETA